MLGEIAIGLVNSSPTSVVFVGCFKSISRVSGNAGTAGFCVGIAVYMDLNWLCLQTQTETDSCSQGHSSSRRGGPCGFLEIIQSVSKWHGLVRCCCASWYTLRKSLYRGAQLSQASPNRTVPVKRNSPSPGLTLHCLGIFKKPVQRLARPPPETNTCVFCL